LEACKRLRKLQGRRGKLLERHLRWAWRWRKELASEFYYKLLDQGFIKPEDREPDTTGFDFYFDAFSELSTTRPIGLGLGPIPFTAIAEYSRLYELPDFDDFAYVIRRMDRVFLEMNDTNAPAQETKKSGSTANKKNPNKG